MCLLTAGCEMKSRSAVRVKLSVRAAVMKTLSRKSSITFQINETASFAAIGEKYAAGIRVHNGPKTGNRTRLPRAHRSRSGRRGPAEAIRQAPEAMQPKSGGGNRRKGDRQPKSGAEPTARQLTAENRTGKSHSKGDRQPKIRCRNRHKTIDHRKPDEQKSLQRRSAAKNPAQKSPQDS